jgi:short-subunit dehydrogenase
MARLSDWRGKVVVVTGASSGIGRLLAERDAAKGARLALVARRLDLLDEVAASIRAAGGEALAVACDVARRDDVSVAVDRIRQHFGGIDVLVNNAGYGRHRRFADWDIDDIERMMQVNYLGSVYWTKAVLPHLIEQRQGWIVFMASVAGRIGVPDESAYVASKFAIVGLAESLSCEVEDAGVHVLTVCPGAIDTPFFDAESLARMPEVAKRSMIGPDKVVDATLNALTRGRHEVTVPGSIAVGYVVRAIAPELMRRQVKKATIG